MISARGPGEDSSMYIQYVGFNIAGSSRIYNFDVIDTKETREFTVKVQSEVFRPAGLKIQDAPDICFARLKQELQGETQEAHADAHLSIGTGTSRSTWNSTIRGLPRKQQSLTVGPNERAIPAALIPPSRRHPVTAKH